MTALQKSRPVLMLVLLTLIYIFNELGHFLLGVLTRSMAQTIEYGDKSCISLQNKTGVSLNKTIGISCVEYTTELSCNSAHLHTDSRLLSCEWNYNGRGIDYQILAGPAFMACFTIAGVLWGITGVKANRIYLLSYASLGVGTALCATAFATDYWHLVVCRMALASCAAACTPLAAGLLGDAFSVSKRAIVMGIFNCGIFVGFGASFIFGTYAPTTSFFSESWRTSFLATGIPPLVLSFLLLLTTKEVRGSSSTENCDNATDTRNVATKKENLVVQLFKLFTRPAVIILMIAASIRHSAGYTWGYNSALFFQTYHPEVDFGWRLTTVTIVGGMIGCVVGGYICDVMAKRYGIFIRILFLAISISIATPFAAATLILEPPFNFLAAFTALICSETWFGAFYAVLLEMAPANQKTTVVAFTVLIINNIGGNLPVFVEPLSKATSYRTALLIQYPGALLTGALLFLVCWLMIRKQSTSTDTDSNSNEITSTTPTLSSFALGAKPELPFPDRSIVNWWP